MLLQAQPDTTSKKSALRKIWVRGQATDTASRHAFPYIMVVNQRTSRGVFGDPNGRFGISALPGDRILVSARGFHTRTIAVDVKSKQDTLDVKVTLLPLEFQLKEVEIFPEREIEEIDQDRKVLGEELRELAPLSGMDALRSPITALYERFSKMERSKRKVAELELQDKVGALLKELFRKYIRYDIIQLSSKDFDVFIQYLDLPADFIRTASQYDLIMAVKWRYEQYRKLKKHLPSSAVEKGN